MGLLAHTGSSTQVCLSIYYMYLCAPDHMLLEILKMYMVYGHINLYGILAIGSLYPGRKIA